MQKIYRFILIAILLCILLSGCIPKIKDSSEFVLPSWDTNMVLPLAKGNLPLGTIVDKALSEIDGLVENPDTSIYSYTFTAESEALTLPELKLETGVLELDFGDIWTQGAIAIDSGLEPIILDYDIDLDVTDQLIPSQNISFKLSDFSKLIQSDRFSKMRLSDNSNNALNFSLTTNEPFEKMTINLIDDETKQIVATSGPIPGPGASGSPTTKTDYSHDFEIPLGSRQISNKLDLEVSVTIHSTDGQISLTTSVDNQLEIVELEGFSIQTVNMQLPSVNIPDIKPLEDSSGGSLVEEIVLKSGKIVLINGPADTADGKEFPFTVEVDNLNLGGENLLNDESGELYIDLSGVTLNESSTLGGSGSFKLNDSFVYDVWDDIKGEIVPYSYSVSLEMENIVAESLKGDIGKIIEDANPETPEWDFKLEEIDSSIQEITYPEELPEEIPEFSNLYLNLDFDNQTSFLGDFTLSITTYEDAQGKIKAKDKNGQPLEASFQINISERSNSSFVLQDEADYDQFIKILNSRPKFISYGVSGAFSASENDFYIDAEDYIQPTFSIEIPLELKIPAGGITVEKVIEQTEEEPVKSIEIVNEYINSAKLHIAYNNHSSFGVGCIVHFSTTSGLKKDMEFLINPNAQDTITLAYDTEIAQILANKSGYSFTADLTIPNPTDQSATFTMKKTDQIDLTIWVDVDIQAHIPDEN